MSPAPVVLVRHARDAEVEHARLRAPDHEDVGRLDVAVHHALAVRVGQRVGDAAHDQRGLRRRRPPAFLAQLAQVAALEQLHRDVGAAGRSTPASNTVTMCGWLRPPAARASLRNSALNASRSSAAISRFRVLMAIRRDSSGSCAAYTVPRPPAPMRVLQRITADVPDGGHLVVVRRRRVGRERDRGTRRRADVGVDPTARCRTRLGGRVGGLLSAGSESAGPGRDGGLDRSHCRELSAAVPGADA